MMQQNVRVILTQNRKPLVMQGIVIMHLNQFRLQSHQTKKFTWKKFVQS